MQLNLPLKESGPRVRIESIIKPLDPPELKGRNIATGRESVICLLTPKLEKTNEMPLLIISNKPLFLKNDIATNIPITYGNILTPVCKPLFAPVTNASKIVVSFSTNFFSLINENTSVKPMIAISINPDRFDVKAFFPIKSSLFT